MSVLSAGTTVHTRRTTTSYLQPQTPQATHVLTWTTARDGLWTARIHHTPGTDPITAGTIERTTTGFQVRDWQGTIETIHPTLETAQHSLEPAVRAAARTATAAIHHRATLLATSTTITALLAFTGIITTWITTQPI